MKCKDCTMYCHYRTSDGEKECELMNHITCELPNHIIKAQDEWQCVRIQASIAAMQGMLSNSGLYLKEGDTFPNLAVRYADALIEVLKEK